MQSHGSHVHRVMTPGISCKTFGGMDRHVIETHRQNHHHHQARTLKRWNSQSRGGRPGVLKDPEPQGGAVTVGYVAAPGPLLEVSSMAGVDSVDGTAVQFLVKKALERQEEEEEKKLEVEERMAHAVAGKPEFARLEWLTMRRRKKKRRKRRLPRTSSYSSRGRAHRRHRQWQVPKSSSSGCPRPCDHQRQFPAVRVPVVTQRTGTHSAFVHPVQLFGHGF